MYQYQYQYRKKELSTDSVRFQSHVLYRAGEAGVSACAA